MCNNLLYSPNHNTAYFVAILSVSFTVFHQNGTDDANGEFVLQEMLSQWMIHQEYGQQLTIPKVIEISNQRTDNETEREPLWEDGSVVTLKKKDPSILAWLFIPVQKNRHGSNLCIFRWPLYAVFRLCMLHAIKDESLRVKVAIALQSHASAFQTDIKSLET